MHIVTIKTIGHVVVHFHQINQLWHVVTVVPFMIAAKFPVSRFFDAMTVPPAFISEN